MVKLTFTEFNALINFFTQPSYCHEYFFCKNAIQPPAMLDDFSPITSLHFTFVHEKNPVLLDPVYIRVQKYTTGNTKIFFASNTTTYLEITVF